MRRAAPRGTARKAGSRYFLSAEDLTTQAGLSVQQDLALVNLLGITHVERNGHHYVNGMAALPQAEQQAFLRRASRPVRAQPRRRAARDPRRPHRPGIARRPGLCQRRDA